MDQQDTLNETPEKSQPGEENTTVSPLEEEALLDFSDIENMEEIASIANTGLPAALVDTELREIAYYTDDQDIIEDFAERQVMGQGTERLLETLSEHNQLSPEISGDDVDARWEDANASGEEAVGGTVPTPDQDVVSELGEAVGLEYYDDEPLNTEDKINRRDENRWELNPSSAEEDNQDPRE